MTSRRQIFLGPIGASKLSFRLPELVSSGHHSPIETGRSDQTTPCFDAEDARRFIEKVHVARGIPKSEDPEHRILDLTKFKNASVEALRLLSSSGIRWRTARFGLSALWDELIRAILELKCPNLEFHNLVKSTPAQMVQLLSSPNTCLTFCNVIFINAPVMDEVKNLLCKEVGNQFAEMAISGDYLVDRSVAEVLVALPVPTLYLKPGRRIDAVSFDAWEILCGSSIKTLDITESYRAYESQVLLTLEQSGAAVSGSGAEQPADSAVEFAIPLRSEVSATSS